MRKAYRTSYAKAALRSTYIINIMPNKLTKEHHAKTQLDIPRNEHSFMFLGFKLVK